MSTYTRTRPSQLSAFRPHPSSSAFSRTLSEKHPVYNRKARLGTIDLQKDIDFLQKNGIAISLFFVENVMEISNLIHERHHENNCIVIGGGDGTLHNAVEAVLDSKLPLGIIPLGTGNDLARTLKIPLKVSQAVEVIAGGTIRRIDLGCVNGTHFFNVANIGLAAKTAENITPRHKRYWGVLAYILIFLQTYHKNEAFQVWLSCDGKTHKFKSIQLAVGNGRYYGGGLTVHEKAQIDDHILNVYSLKPQKIWQLLRHAHELMQGKFHNNDQVWVTQGRDIKVLTRKALAVDTDGELTTRTPAHFQICEQILPIYTPGVFHAQRI